MRIAWFSPFSRNSAIGAFSAAIVQQLSRMAEVYIYASDLQDPSNAWFHCEHLCLLPKLDLSTLSERLRKYDIVVYNLGDNLDFHRDIFRMSRQVPGIVILHDLVMHHFFSGYYLKYKRDPEGYVRELEYAHGAPGRELGLKIIHGEIEGIWEDRLMLDYHMAKAAISQAYGVVVHSQYAKHALAEFATVPVIQIHFPLFGVSERVEQQKPRISKRDQGKLHLLTYGMLNRNKMVGEVIQAIGESRYLREHVAYTVLGNSIQSEAERLIKLIRDYKLHDQVELLLGWRPEEELYANIVSADIIINLRNPHFGETSSVLHESMAMGKPTIVWKHGYYDEVPDDAVAKVDSLSTLQTTIERLCQDTEYRRGLGERAEAYARKTFVTENYCSAFLQFAESTLYNKPVIDLIDFASDALIELGIGLEEHHMINKVCQQIAEMMGFSATGA